MKGVCSTGALHSAISQVSRVISGNSTLPILEHILLKIEGEKLVLLATVLEVSVQLDLLVNDSVDGSITIPAKALLNTVQYSKTDIITLEKTKENELTCTTPNGKAVLQGGNEGDFPNIASLNDGKTYTLAPKDIKQAFDYVLYAAARSALRPALTGAYFQSDESSLNIVATDSFRLSLFTLPLPSTEDAPDVIIPVKVLEELQYALSHNDGDDQLTMMSDGQQVGFVIGNTRLISRVIDAKYPNYKQIIPTESETVIICETAALLNGVKRLHYFAKETNNNLTYTFSKEGNLHIKTYQTQAGSDEITIPISVKKPGNEDEIKIALNSIQLIEFLSHLPNKEVQIELINNTKPAILRNPDVSSFMHLMMPLRIQE